MIQAVVHAGQRESLGMHYTSVENIMKVIRPLFLDELHEAFDRQTQGKAGASTATDLGDEILRPSLRFRELSCHRLQGAPQVGASHPKADRRNSIRRLQEVSSSFSQIKLENFFGIEMDDFAHEIAILRFGSPSIR